MIRFGEICVLCLGIASLGGATAWIVSRQMEPVIERLAGDPSQPIVDGLLAEIAAREAELDDLVNTLNGAIAERNEAIALLRKSERDQTR